VAITLINFGNVYGYTGRLGEAEKALTEALATYRDLATHDPGAYRPNLAATLNNLGILYIRTPADQTRQSRPTARRWRSGASSPPMIQAPTSPMWPRR
jgi:hypothetical protein